MQVIDADALGLCFGVRRALKLLDAIEEPSSSVIYGELVHNERVQAGLEESGFTVQPESQRDRLPALPRVVVTAHGISESRRATLLEAGKELVDTTCPLVTRIHDAARELVARGFELLVVGRAGHVEVEGIVEDFEGAVVIGSPEEVPRTAGARLGLVAQSTAPPRLVERVVARLRALHPHARIEIRDTVCAPTRRRQEAVTRLAQRVEAVVVVGGRSSNNTRQLASLAEEHGLPVFRVADAGQLDESELAHFEVVGLTAGTSTPDATIAEVRERLRRIPSAPPRAAGSF